ncbi:hypothetical protein [Enterococcus rivorum]|nr:hypothetical protein [Enterococcus rivorum]MBP2097449.1 hypothetical protein [Enterococcus rivorum]
MFSRMLCQLSCSSKMLVAYMLKGQVNRKRTEKEIATFSTIIP